MLSLTVVRKKRFKQSRKVNKWITSMSATRVFLGLPDLQKLCCVVATLQENNNEDARSRQRITCRELVFLHSDVLACPGLDSFDHIQVVMATTFLQTGIVQLFGEQRHLQLGPPQRVSPGVLQCCLSFSLITRLAPSWNKAASYLVAGRDFLSESGRLEAVSEWSTCSTSERRGRCQVFTHTHTHTNTIYQKASGPKACWEIISLQSIFTFQAKNGSI